MNPHTNDFRWDFMV